MKILLERCYKKKNYTIGRLYIDGEYFCDTLEDTDRGFTNELYDFEIKRAKVYGKSAIPTGTYRISLSVYSTKFGSKKFYKEVCDGRLPRLLNVPGFSGILIHCGVDESNTEGCILIGLNTSRGELSDSKEIYKKFIERIKNQSNLYITIK